MITARKKVNLIHALQSGRREFIAKGAHISRAFIAANAQRSITVNNVLGRMHRPRVILMCISSSVHL